MDELMFLNRKILLLLKSLAVNYPILKFYDLILPTLVLLVVDRGQGIGVMNLLMNRGTQRIDTFMSEHDMMCVLTETNSDFAVYFYTASRKGRDRLMDLITIARDGRVAGREVNALILVVSEGFPPGIPKDSVFTICMEGELAEMEFISDSEVVPPDEQLPVVLDRMESALCGCGSLEETVFRAATCFLYPCLQRENREIEFRRFLAVADKLWERNDACVGDEDIETLVLRELYKWREDTGFSDACELPDLDERATSNLERVIMFDDRYVYMAEKLFKNAIKPLLEIFPVMMILSGLAQSGVIVPGAAGTYTAKVGFYDEAGKYHRKCCLRLRRDRLEQLGEQGFVEQCLM